MPTSAPTWELQSAVIGLRTFFSIQTLHLPFRYAARTKLPPDLVPMRPDLRRGGSPASKGAPDERASTLPFADVLRVGR